MAVSLDAKGKAGGGVTLTGFGVQFLSIGVTLGSEGVSLTPVNAAWFGASGSISLSNTLVNVLSSVGTKVGTLSVSGGSTRPYTFTLVTDPSTYFSVGGSTLSVNAAMVVGTDTITVRASDTGTSVINGAFAITIFSTASGATGSLSFNNVNNSMYVPLLGGIG